MKGGVVWDNHACMPLRVGDRSFLPQLARYRAVGVDVVSLNVGFDLHPWETTFGVLTTFRRWITLYSDQYVVALTTRDIEQAKRDGKLAIVFDIEGGRAVEGGLAYVDLFYGLGVRWMLIAYNRNNALGGGCQEFDHGLTAYGRCVIDEMERVGMVLCCSHTGYRTAREAMEYSRNPVIFSHSNPRGMWDHERNIPDELIYACAKTGGVIGLNGIGIFLGQNDNRTATFIRHVDYLVDRVGVEHVGLGLDYVFDRDELDGYLRSRPDLFPPDKGYAAGIEMIEPERIPKIAEALLDRGYNESQVQGILGGNHLRIARTVWK